MPLRLLRPKRGHRVNKVAPDGQAYHKAHPGTANGKGSILQSSSPEGHGAVLPGKTLVDEEAMTPIGESPAKSPARTPAQSS